MSWIAKSSDVVETVLEDGAILLNLETKFYYSLNNTGYKIWQLIDNVNSSQELIENILSDYDSQQSEINENVSDFLKDLEEQKLTTTSDGANTTSNSEVSNIKEPSEKKSFQRPELIKHDEPLHEVVQNPFDPQLPLAE